MPSRAAAVGELLKRGFAAGGFTAAAYGPPNPANMAGSKSSEYGVTGETPAGRR